MSEANKMEIYRNLPDKRIKSIVQVLKKFYYSNEEMEENILPYLTQWLYNEYVSIESTCLIISEIINIEHIEEKIEQIYDGKLTLMSKSKLIKELTDEEYTALENAISPRKTDGIIKGKIDENLHIIVNFKIKKILQQKTIFKANGETDIKTTPIIEAVPKKLIVYDSPLMDQPRTFKIVWTTNVSQNDFTIAGDTTGADIQEIEQYLINAGYSHNPRLVSGAVSCMINTMIQEKMVDIRTDIDNDGVYYNVNKGSITVIGLNYDAPSFEEMELGHDVLSELASFYEDNLETFVTVFKWGLMSIFSYSMKQYGKWMPWLYLKGSAGSGKTTLANVILYLYDLPSHENNVGGSSVDTVARLGRKIKESCKPIVVNEPRAVFKRDSTREMIKVSIESTTSRGKYSGKTYKKESAFAPIVFTANQYLPEDDALIRRLYVMSFYYSQRKTNDDKKRFDKKFHITTPRLSNLKALSVFGRFAIREIIVDSSLLLNDWKDTADYILDSFYEELGISKPSWLDLWSESESLEDLDDTQKEDFRNFFINEFNSARGKVNIIDGYGNRKEYLDIDGVSTSDDFEHANWQIVNKRLLSWAIPYKDNLGDDYICITKSLRKLISKETGFSNDLKSIAELLGWEYAKLRVDNSSMRVIRVPFEDFMKFLYPSFG